MVYLIVCMACRLRVRGVRGSRGRTARAARCDVSEPNIVRRTPHAIFTPTERYPEVFKVIFSMNRGVS